MRVLTNPMPDISRLYTSNSTAHNVSIGGNGGSVTLARGAQLDVMIELQPAAALDLLLLVFAPSSSSEEEFARGQALQLLVDSRPDGFSVRDPYGHQLALHGEPLRSLRLLVDRSVIELFANGGRAALTTWHCQTLPQERTSTDGSEQQLADGLVLRNLDPESVLLQRVTVHELATANVRPPTTAAEAHEDDAGVEHELSSCRG